MALWPVSQLKHGAHPPAVTRPEAPTTPLPSPLALSARHSRRDSGVRSDSLRGARSQALLSKLQSSGLVRFDDVSSKPCLDEQALLELCDAARAGLLEGSMTEAVAEKVTRFLRAAVKDESLGIATIELSTITNTRLDKLVADLQSPENFIGTNLPHFWRDYAAAERLQRLWRARFRERYFDVDQTRYSNLPEQGLLRYVDFDDTKRGHGHLWQAVACELLSGGQGNMQFEAGH
ncbi:hypothetical protein G6O67_006901 [Ophiocordyceps sinensis]|uniref:Uncharacterized protein n=1 Tax=Ophiocordyceps sinensis TaxID=72228 RepID=A0A8H4LWP1_9HYPO|nr:hypothetical protein G6O67_006901 [Ophiocordyceps sinensis]